MGYMTRLDAINKMLIASGENIVSDLENQSGVDTSIAEFMLDQKIIDYQMRGLANNQLNRSYTPGANGEIELPLNTLSGWLTSSHTNKDGEQIRGVIKGNPPYLFNFTDDTSLWESTGEYHVYLVLKLDWEDMDTSVQQAIIMQAAREYQMMSQGDGDVDNYLAQLSLYYEAAAKGQDNSQKRYNILNGPENSISNAVNRQIFNRNARFPRG